MLDLRLRDEFCQRRASEMAIELGQAKKRAAEDFFAITYPSADAINILESCASLQGGSILLMGDRGKGKSHLLAMLYHALTNRKAAKEWLKTWAVNFNEQKLLNIDLPTMEVIGEAVHRQNYKSLWEMIFDQHSCGKEILKKWEGLGERKTSIPSLDLLVELFAKSPTVLILDEFQTWYESLSNTDEDPQRNRAFNFIQLLAEIAEKHPELMVLVVSVRDNKSAAIKQIRRSKHILIDFAGPKAKEDRRSLLLHRLFKNRRNISGVDIENLVKTHVSEYLRLVKKPGAEYQNILKQFLASWPFAPYLLETLEDQVLFSDKFQETRDLIRILANLFKENEDSLILTAADFDLDDEDGGAVAIIDSLSSGDHHALREVARRNVEAVKEAISDAKKEVPHLCQMVGSLWLHSLPSGEAIASGKTIAGATPRMLQVDITREHRIDDNHFEIELNKIVENSFNIHEENNRFLFLNKENPYAKLMAHAKNDKQFTDGSDLAQLAQEVRRVLTGSAGSSNNESFRVVVLGSRWREEPWQEVAETDRPERWGKHLPFLVLPDAPKNLSSVLGCWLRDHMGVKRNTVRFLFPNESQTSLFEDRDLVVLARAVLLATRWRNDGEDYKRLLRKSRGELETKLSKMFDRFAIIDRWDYRAAERCELRIESHGKTGSSILKGVDDFIREHLFVPEDFRSFVVDFAGKERSVGKLLQELQEPRQGGEECLPWLGETETKEKIIPLCARGDIAINVGGKTMVRVKAGESESEALRRMRGTLSISGRDLDETILCPVQAEPQAKGGGVVDERRSDILSPSLEDAAVAVVRDAADSSKEASNIFAEPTRLVPYFSESTSSLNLLGKIESWGIVSGTDVRDCSLEIEALTGDQLNELLRSLPDGVTYALRLQRGEK